MHTLRSIVLLTSAIFFVTLLSACMPVKTDQERPVFEVVSLNVFGYKTMPKAAAEYAAYIQSQNADIVGIQEGVQDWALNGAKFPTDYSRSASLAKALGECWIQHYQILINTCRGNTLVQNYRWDLTDGDLNKATRTGETAVIQKGRQTIAFINVHWEAFNATSRAANVGESSQEVLKHNAMPVITLGDFNSDCDGTEVGRFLQESSSELIYGADIDCITGRGVTGIGRTFDASPSDHPGVSATVYILTPTARPK